MNVSSIHLTDTRCINHDIFKRKNASFHICILSWWRHIFHQAYGKIWSYSGRFSWIFIIMKYRKEVSHVVDMIHRIKYQLLNTSIMIISRTGAEPCSKGVAMTCISYVIRHTAGSYRRVVWWSISFILAFNVCSWLLIHKRGIRFLFYIICLKLLQFMSRKYFTNITHNVQCTCCYIINRM